MAIFKLFPNKDTTLYSQFPDQNTGLDQILEVFNKTHNTDPLYISTAEVARYLISFDSSEINDVITNKISGSQWQSNLRLFNAKTTGIVTNTNLYCYPLAQDWTNGTGKLNDYPNTENGASWSWNTFNGNTRWTSSGFTAYTTASFQTANSGGGVWYTGSISGTLEFSQSFNINSDKDINFDITRAVNLWQSGSISNYGLIVKWGSDIEFNQSESIEPNMNLFSMDTHTIYPPQLEFKWNDWSFNTGSNNVGFISASMMVLSFPNNKGFYNQNEIKKFRLNCRPQYPNRQFQTSSFYIANYYLPQSSSYAIKDLDTNEFVVDFDDVYTKISADSEGNYFKVWMSGFEPERYYVLLVKTVLNGETQIIDDNNYFKVVNG